MMIGRQYKVPLSRSFWRRINPAAKTYTMGQRWMGMQGSSHSVQSLQRISHHHWKCKGLLIVLLPGKKLSQAHHTPRLEIKADAAVSLNAPSVYIDAITT
ncbi:hypothetical protein WJX79_010390 [Trebouxia sp. C0005]